MTEAIQKIGGQVVTAQTAADIRAQVNLIQEVMRSVMKNGTHYGTIPGTPKPTLFKPGAEKILMTFQLVCGEPQVMDLSTHDEARYRVMVPVLTRSGVLCGSGVGECSSSEEKYRWRKPVCDEEFDETPEDRRRVKWVKAAKPYQQKQIRTNHADVANTILKMAHKRGLVAATLVTTAASDVFDQDIEDLPEELRQQHADPRPPVEMPKPKAKPEAPKQEAQTEGETVKGVIEEVSEKSGETNGKAWVKFGVKVGGKWYGTFDAVTGQTAKDAEGLPVTITYKADGKYATILTMTVDDDAGELPL